MKCYITGSKISCGINEIYGLNLGYFKDLVGANKHSQAKFLELQNSNRASGQGSAYVYSQTLSPNQAYIFSDTTYGQGKVIAQFIKDNDLGEIKEHGSWRNPNSGNQIFMWLWNYNGKKIPEVPVNKAA
jgi:hypothetical protein